MGRPSKDVEHLSVTLPFRQVRWLKEAAKDLGIPVSGLLATLIEPHARLAARYAYNAEFEATMEDGDGPTEEENGATVETHTA